MTEHSTPAPRLPDDPSEVIAWFEAHPYKLAELHTACDCPLAIYLKDRGAFAPVVRWSIYYTDFYSAAPEVKGPSWQKPFVEAVDACRPNRGQRIRLSTAARILRSIAEGALTP